MSRTRSVPRGLALAVLAAVAASRPDAVLAADGHPVPVSLMVELTADEGSISVAQAYRLAGSGSGTWTLPLVLPETGPRPRMVERVGEQGGVLVRARGGASARLGDGVVVVAGSPGPTGDFGVEIQYDLPVQASRLVLAAVAPDGLAGVQVIHPGGPHALHVRPLAPFSYREESEGDGTWRTQELLEPIDAGGSLRIAVGRLPAASGPYRAAALAVLLAVAAGGIVAGLRRREG